MSKGKDVLDEAVAAFKLLSVGDQQEYIKQLQETAEGARQAKVAELMEQLEALGAAPTPKRRRTGGGNRNSPKPKYRTPDGSFEWSGRGALPKAFKALGVKSKEDMAKYEISE